MGRRTPQLADACLLEVTSPAGPQKSSCSGILIDRQRGLVVTHASVLLNHLSSNHFQTLITKSSLSAKCFNSLSVTITLRAEKQPAESPSYSTGLINVNVSGSLRPQPEHYSIRGSIQRAWKVQSFASTLNTLFPSSSGWSFHENPDKQETAIDKEKLASLLPYFVLVKLQDWQFIGEGAVNLVRNQLHTTDVVYAVGTPFGNLSPTIFLNSTSRGIVCNVAGTKREMILTDARCIPGTEGGAIYNDEWELCGMVVAPMCWKESEWIGLAICCSMHEILNSIISLTSESKALLLHAPEKASPRRGHSCIVMVNNSGTWGSGVIFNHQKGLVLTCSHVIKGANKVSVRIDEGDIQTTYESTVVYAVPRDAIFDLAVLRMHDFSSDAPDPTPTLHFTEGDAALVEGHALFGRSHAMSASVTQGVISRVVTHNDTALLVQSSCAVHAGASGGVLFNSEDQMIGIVTCNARDIGTGASFPHINLCVPFCSIWDILQDYVITMDEEVLKKFHLKNAFIKKLWLMQAVPSISSKL